MWVQFESKEAYLKEERNFLDMISDYEGNDSVVVYCAKERVVKRLPANRNINIEQSVLARLQNRYSEKNIKVLEKSIENKI